MPVILRDCVLVRIGTVATWFFLLSRLPGTWPKVRVWRRCCAWPVWARLPSCSSLRWGGWFRTIVRGFVFGGRLSAGGTIRRELLLSCGPIRRCFICVGCRSRPWGLGWRLTAERKLARQVVVSTAANCLWALRFLRLFLAVRFRCVRCRSPIQEDSKWPRPTSFPASLIYRIPAQFPLFRPQAYSHSQ